MTREKSKARQSARRIKIINDSMESSLEELLSVESSQLAANEFLMKVGALNQDGSYSSNYYGEL